MRNLLKSFALAVAGALSLSSAALAGDEIRVNHSDLDLSRPVDAQVFRARVSDAVADYCRENRHRFAGSNVPLQACRHEATAAVERAIPDAQRQALQIARARPLPIELAAR